MYRSWLSTHHVSGKITLYRSETTFGITPGQTVDFAVDFVLERIVLQWSPHPLQGHVQYEVMSYDDLDPKSGERIGPTDSIAGLFSFVVSERDGQIVEVLPGPLSPTLVLSTLAHHVKHKSSLSNETLTTLMAQEAVVAAEEIAHSLWNAIGVAPSLMETAAANAPRFEAVKEERCLKHTITTAMDCRNAFRRALLQQASKLLRLSRSQQINPNYNKISPRGAATDVGGEAIGISSPLDGLDESAPFRMSRSTRNFNHARGACLNIPEIHRNDTADAILGGRRALRLDSAVEITQFEVTTDLSKRPVRVELLKNCRASFMFGPHLFLVTGLRFATTWNAESYSPFSNFQTLLEDVERYHQTTIRELKDLTMQYVPREDQNDEKGEKKAPNPEIIESAFMTCKPPMRDSLTPIDLEAAMIRAGVANIGDPQEGWFDLVREFDFDNTGFMEYNEFYLLCHRLTEDQLRRLTYISIPGKMKVGEKWEQVCIDFDAWTGGISVYSDVHSFVKSPTDRLKMKRTEGKVWDLGDITRSTMKEQTHRAPTHSLFERSGAHYDFQIEDSDLITFYKMVNWIIYVNRFRQSQFLRSVDTTTLKQLALSATHSYAS